MHLLLDSSLENCQQYCINKADKYGNGNGNGNTLLHMIIQRRIEYADCGKFESNSWCFGMRWSCPLFLDDIKKKLCPAKINQLVRRPMDMLEKAISRLEQTENTEKKNSARELRKCASQLKIHTTIHELSRLPCCENARNELLELRGAEPETYNTGNPL